jgi:hypothetical protein
VVSIPLTEHLFHLFGELWSFLQAWQVALPDGLFVEVDEPEMERHPLAFVAWKRAPLGVVSPVVAS